MEEYAAALAVANASCSNARQNDIENKRRKRSINGPRVLRLVTGRNCEMLAGAWFCNRCGFALMGSMRCKLEERRGRISPSPQPFFVLLRCQFLGFAFGTHQLERSLGFLVGLRNFL